MQKNKKKKKMKNKMNTMNVVMNTMNAFREFECDLCEKLKNDWCFLFICNVTNGWKNIMTLY